MQNSFFGINNPWSSYAEEFFKNYASGFPNYGNVLMQQTATETSLADTYKEMIRSMTAAAGNFYDLVNKSLYAWNQAANRGKIDYTLPFDRPSLPEEWLSPFVLTNGMYKEYMKNVAEILNGKSTPLPAIPTEKYNVFHATAEMTKMYRSMMLGLFDYIKSADNPVQSGSSRGFSKKGRKRRLQRDE